MAVDYQYDWSLSAIKQTLYEIDKNPSVKPSLSRAFAGVEVGIKEMEDGDVSFLDYDLGYFDDKSRKVEPITDPFGTGKVYVSGMDR